jgi:hypothetical protein
MTVDELRQELDQEARTTRRVLERIPEDRAKVPAVYGASADENPMAP